MVENDPIPTPTPTLTPGYSDAAYTSRIALDGAIHHWRMDSSTPVDQIGNNDLTLFNNDTGNLYTHSVDIVSSGIGLASADFTIDYDNQYASNAGFQLATPIDTSTFTNGHTIEGWVNLRKPPANKHFYGSLLGTIDSAFGFEFYGYVSNSTSEGFLDMSIRGAPNSPGAYVDIPFETYWGQWVHLVCTIDASGTFKIYFNRNEVAGGINAPARVYGFVGTDYDSERQDGKLDEVAVYDYVLSPAQITNHYNIGFPLAI